MGYVTSIKVPVAHYDRYKQAAKEAIKSGVTAEPVKHYYWNEETRIMPLRVNSRAEYYAAKWACIELHKEINEKSFSL